MKEIMLAIALLGGSVEAGHLFHKKVMDTQKNVEIVMRQLTR